MKFLLTITLSAVLVLIAFGEQGFSGHVNGKVFCISLREGVCPSECREQNVFFKTLETCELIYEKEHGASTAHFIKDIWIEGCADGLRDDHKKRCE